MTVPTTKFHYRMNQVWALLLPPPLSPGTDDFGGFLFICDHFTARQSFRRMVFGLREEYLNWVVRIRPGLPLFLLDTGTNALYGVYEAASNGGLNIDPLFCPNLTNSGSSYPAQVRFRPWYPWPFPPLPRCVFEPIVTYYSAGRFPGILCTPQAHTLMEFFYINWTMEMDIARRRDNTCT